MRNPWGSSGASKACERAGSKEAGCNIKPRQIISRTVLEWAEPFISRRRRDTAVRPGTGGGAFSTRIAEQERPPRSLSGKGGTYKAERLKSHGAGRESEGFVVPMKACKTTRRREGALL